MSAGAQLSVTDQRRMTRHPVDYPVIAEHFGKGDVRLHIANISAAVALLTAQLWFAKILLAIFGAIKSQNHMGKTHYGGCF